MLTSSISIRWRTTLFYGKKIFLGPWVIKYLIEK